MTIRPLPEILSLEDAMPRLSTYTAEDGLRHCQVCWEVLPKGKDGPYCEICQDYRTRAKRRQQKHRPEVKARKYARLRERLANDPEWAAKERARKRKVQQAAYNDKGKRGERERIRARIKSTKRKRAEGQGGFAPDDWLARVSEYGGRCAYCGCMTTKGGKVRRLTMDHVVPLSRGGKHVISNVVPCCIRCNLAKGIKLWTPRSVSHNETHGAQVAR